MCEILSVVGTPPELSSNNLVSPLSNHNSVNNNLSNLSSNHIQEDTDSDEDLVIVEPIEDSVRQLNHSNSTNRNGSDNNRLWHGPSIEHVIKSNNKVTSIKDYNNRLKQSVIKEVKKPGKSMFFCFYNFRG